MSQEEGTDTRETRTKPYNGIRCREPGKASFTELVNGNKMLI